MSHSVTLRPIAHIRSDFPEKFGIPRQSGLVEGLRAEIVFTPEYRTPQALRGIEEFSHLWLIWQFSGTAQRGWTPTVRPPRLGGNVRKGVFATRSPFRPNGLGLSSVGLAEVRLTGPEGPVLVVTGADLLDGTPIFDIKPYLPYTDAHPDASGGFALQQRDGVLRVDFPPELLAQVSDPFTTTRTTRKMGLGIPLLRMSAELTGGSLSIASTLGAGTRLQAVFDGGHIDCPPLGDLPGTVSLLIQGAPDLRLVYTHRRDGQAFTLDTQDLRDQLGGGISLAEPEVVLWIREYLEEQEGTLKPSVS